MEEIKICISSPQKFKNNINTVMDKFKRDNDLAPNFILFADEIFQSNESLLKKYLLLMLIREALYTNPIGSVTNKLASNNSILNYLQDVVNFQPGSDDQYKGLYRFENDTPQIAIKYFNLILELIKFLAEKYPVTQSNKPTKFKILYDRLIQQGIIFPNQNRELEADVSEIEEAVEESQPIKRNQVQQMQQNQENGIHQLEELQIEMNDQIDTIWDMLNDQNCNLEGAKDMLQFYHDTFKESDAKLQQLEYELSDKLSQQQKEQIELLCNFIKTFNLKFNHFERNKTKNGFLEFQHSVLTEASKITKKHYTPSDAYQKSKIQPLSPVRQVGQDDTQYDLTTTQIEKKEKVVSQINYQKEIDQQNQFDQQRLQEKPKQVEKVKVVQQQYNQYDEHNPLDQENQFQNQQYQYDQQLQQKQYQEQQQNQKYYNQNQQKQNKPVNQNNTLLLETDYSQFEQTVPHQHKNYFEQDYQQQQSRQEDNHNSLESYQDQFTQKPQGMKLTFGNGVDQEQDQKNKGQSQVQFKEIQEQYQQIPKLQQYGVLKTDHQQSSHILDIQQKLNRSGYTQEMIDVWKKTCLLGKGNLFENELVRVYCTIGLQFQVLNNKNYLKISMYIFNKIDQNLSINIKFQGDKSTKFWIKQDNKKILERELQYLIIVDECKELINCKIQIDNQFFNVLLPTSQFNFIDFLDLRAEIFQVKIKDVRFYQSQPFRLKVGWDTFKKIRFTEVNNYYGAAYGNNNYIRVLMIEKNVWIIEATDQNIVPQLFFLFS